MSLLPLPAYIGPGAGFAFMGSFLSLLLALLAGLVSLLIWPFRVLHSLLSRRRGTATKVICLGFDGLDPKITEELMSQGKLPNFAHLKETGGYSRLRTTFPALSPVAWSTFATGVNPAKHNIFDFLNRDLRTYAPELSSAKVTRKSVEMRRKSQTFWKILGGYGVPSTILRVPITFPPEKFPGKLLSAMCTPDLRGTQGTFSRFTGPSGEIEGPPGEKIPFHLRDSTLEIQGRTYTLQPGEYTPWVRLKFPSAWGIVRFLITPAGLYATPVQIDPERPAMPISHPRYFATYLAKLLGSFSTLGMAEDTVAMNDGALDESAFLEQAKLVQQEREAMFFNALDHTRRGVIACVFDTSDRVQHMCFDKPDVIEHLYRDMDRILGRTLGYVDSNTAIYVLSDHGFCSFRRGVNLNSWLEREGFLTRTEEPGDYLQGIDWSRTQAYTFGLAGLYLNLRGREAQGIVEPHRAEALTRDLAARLSGLRDDGCIAIEAAYPAADIYQGPYLGAAPDLIVGYAAGYRASWGAAVGRVEAEVFEDNDKPWRGDHCVDPHLVPGVLFSNRPLNSENPGIEDMAPTVLNLFGIRPPLWMEGRPV